jgi:hypothetical protein
MEKRLETKQMKLTKQTLNFLVTLVNHGTLLK